MGDISILLTILGLAGTVAAAVLGLWLHRRGREKRQLTMEMHEVPLTPAIHVGPKRLALSYGDDHMEHPHVVRLELSHTGREDVGNENFNNNEPITVHIGQQVIAEAMIQLGGAEPGRKENIWAVGGDGRSVALPPGLFRKGDKTIVCQLLVDGVPELKISESMKDARVVDGAKGGGPRKVILAVVALYAIATLLTTIGLAPAAFSEARPASEAILFATLLMVLAASASLLLQLTARQWKRLYKAKK